ncbi:glycosyltransferase 61 family protein [Yunchengibacter salinarum]|uniref:glycosyltransferase 61 family protein n=1 Tax=Yunchengibacter salinarum TaxID=3133399 RepID=UPI0035B5B5E4
MNEDGGPNGVTDTLTENALLCPVTGAERGPLLPGARGGVLDADGAPVAASALLRRYRPVHFDASGRPAGHLKRREGTETALITPPDSAGDARDHLPGTALFAGYLFPHFGHFLLESLAMLATIRAHPHMPLVWLPVHGTGEVLPWQRAILDALAVHNPVHLISTPTRVDRLLVATPGYRIQEKCTPHHVAAMAVLPAKEPLLGKRLWLSRSRLDGARLLNEQALENRLREAGWTIIHPETLSVPDQLAMLADAERIAGVEGSAFHLLMLFSGLKARLDLFARGPTISANYRTIARAYGWNQQEHGVPVRQVDGRPQWKADYVWPDTAPVLAALDVPPHPARPARVNAPTIKRLQTLADALGAERYLEIGAMDGRTGLGLTIPTRHLVDPNPRVTPEGEGVSLFHMTSDQFFAAGIGAGEYDLIFLSGRPGFQALLRDFQWAVSRSHARTVILMDGTWPPSPAAAQPTSAPAFRRHGPPGDGPFAWAADGFKTVLFLHDHMPGWQYATIRSGLVGQTLVWREPRLPQPQSALPLGELEGVVYKDLGRLRDRFHILPEAQALARCLKGAGPAGATEAGARNASDQNASDQNGSDQNGSGQDEPGRS